MSEHDRVKGWNAPINPATGKPYLPPRVSLSAAYERRLREIDQEFNLGQLTDTYVAQFPSRPSMQVDY